MDSPLLLLACTAGLALLAGTLHSIKQNLIFRPAAQARLTSARVFGVVEGLLWTASLLTLIAAAPHPIMILIAMLFLVSVLTAHRLRYQEEKQSLNRWLRIASESEASLPLVLDDLAAGCRSRLARQAKACAVRLDRGETIVDAIHRAKLPVDAETLAAIVFPLPSIAGHDNSRSLLQRIDPEPDFQRSALSARPQAMVFQQFSYIVVTILLAWLIGLLVRSIIVPTFEYVFSEFTSRDQLPYTGLPVVVLMGHLLTGLVAVWLFFAFVLRWLPLWFVRWVPWFGNRAIDQWRGEVLSALGRGMQAGRSESQILQSAARGTRIRWIRARCHETFQLVESGVPLPQALKQGNLVSSRERTWLSSAQKNGNLVGAIQALVETIRRRQLHRWRIRMTWLVPLATVLVGGYVLAHAIYLFHFLVASMGGV
ncbi:type II secretion system F family protein [Stieleria sp. TO1_6]|uniref:type II secretion system F family protein n=1 Tax=Stieleria tagensis TaxID=2956795 RepID=UPI00209B6A32|nr:type II secretion system F family protein [Stieleria tagensis]MCO8125396.1 type II secretion system F family protein [Stieleria tagensis]